LGSLGLPWDALGLFWGAPGLPWNALGLLWDALGLPWGAVDIFSAVGPEGGGIGPPGPKLATATSTPGSTPPAFNNDLGCKLRAPPVHGDNGNVIPGSAPAKMREWASHFGMDAAGLIEQCRSIDRARLMYESRQPECLSWPVHQYWSRVEK
jgi:hypothetical protein